MTKENGYRIVTRQDAKKRSSPTALDHQSTKREYPNTAKTLKESSKVGNGLKNMTKRASLRITST
jgi:hypothetical protein